MGGWGKEEGEAEGRCWKCNFGSFFRSRAGESGPKSQRWGVGPFPSFPRVQSSREDLKPLRNGGRRASAPSTQAFAFDPKKNRKGLKRSRAAAAQLLEVRLVRCSTLERLSRSPLRSRG